MSDKSGTQLSDLGLTNDQISDLIIQRERHILNKYIYKLGEIFLPRNTMRSMLQETIINMVSIIKLLPPIVVRCNLGGKSLATTNDTIFVFRLHPLFVAYKKKT